MKLDTCMLALRLQTGPVMSSCVHMLVSLMLLADGSADAGSEAVQIESDRTLLYFALENDGMALQNATLRLRDDEQLVSMAMWTHPEAIQFASPRLKADTGFLLSNLHQSNGKAMLMLQYVDPIVFTRRDFVLQAIKACQCSEPYAKAPQKLRSDKRVVVKALPYDLSILKSLSPSLQEDRDVLLVVASQPGSSIAGMPLRFRADRDFVVQAIKARGDGYLLCEVEPSLRSDLKTVEAAVGFNLLTVGCASQELRKDSALVLNAIRQSVARKTSEQDIHGLCSVDASLLADPDFMLEVVKLVPQAYALCVNPQATNKELALAAVSGDVEQFQKVPWALQDDRDVVLATVAHRQCCRHESGFGLHGVAPKFRADREVVLAAVKSDGASLKYAAEPLRADLEILKAAGAAGLQFAPVSYRADAGFMLEQIQDDAAAVSAVAASLLSDRDFIFTASEQLRQMKSERRPVPDASLCRDSSFVFEAVQRHQERMASTCMSEHRAELSFSDEQLILLVTADSRFLWTATVAQNQSWQLMYKAIEVNPESYRFVTPVFRDKITTMYALRHREGLTDLVPEMLLSDAEVVLAMVPQVQQPAQFWAKLPESLKTDQRFLWHVLEIRGEFIEQFTVEQQARPDLAMLAMARGALSHQGAVGVALFSNDAFMLSALKDNPKLFDLYCEECSGDEGPMCPDLFARVPGLRRQPFVAAHLKIFASHAGPCD